MAFIRTFKPLAANRNRNGDNGSPCRKPLSKGNSPVGLLLTKTEAEVVHTHSFIDFLSKVGNDILPITAST
ncbi:hypothetical protein L195_g003136 [Trifolium pratense]|uniref:Uncharacterized protein n=1 Tax=Trifolium pratense TaxID=57577 RepID=A0A2K3NUG7_TRIPR|nr:hypothetical protein L195_g003136 [Trifolium pratense]